MNKAKKIILVCISVIVLFTVTIIPAFANDLGTSNDLVATPASNIKSIVFVLDTGTSGLADERIEIDYWNLLRNSVRYSSAIEIPRDDTYIIGGESYTTRYRISISTTRVSGYAKNSLYVASIFPS